MENPMKKAESLLSYDQDKSEVDEKRKKKPLPAFLIWQTRRKSIQAYMCLTLNLVNMLQFSGALIIYGGVAWVSYFTWAVIIGVPMITAELALGHYINNEVKYVWRMCRIGKGIFWNSLLSTFAIATLCHVYLTVLLQLSFQQNDLQFRNHILSNQNDYCSSDKSHSNANDEVNGTYCLQEERYLHLSNHLNQTYLHLPKSQIWIPLLHLTAICFLMILINCKGVRSLEKVTVLFVLVPCLCAVILAMLIFTLPGSVSYIGQCWHLDWYKLQDFSVWLVTFKTVVNVFSIGTLGLIFVSVHSDYQDDIMIDVVILSLNIFLNTLLYTITLLGLVGVIDGKTKLTAGETNFDDYIYVLMKVINGLSELPPPRWLWKFLFYSYLMGSALAQQTFMVATIIDVVISLVPKFRANKFYVTTCLCIAFSVLGFLIFLMEVLKIPRIDSSLVTIGFLQSVTIFWIYNYERVCADFHFLMGYRPSLFYQITWVISPIVFFGVMLSLLILHKDIDLIVNNDLYLMMLHIFIFGVCAFIEAFKLWRKGDSINIFQAEGAWGPNDPLLKKSRIIFKSRIITKEHIYRQKLYEEQLVKPADLTNQNIVQLI